MKILHLELDVMNEDSIHAQASEHFLASERVTSNGPGGGWPAYRFTGLATHLVEFLVNVYDEPLADAWELVQGAADA